MIDPTEIRRCKVCHQLWYMFGSTCTPCKRRGIFRGKPDKRLRSP